MKKFNLFLVCILAAGMLSSQTTATFENLNLPLDTFWNGSDMSGGFSSGNAYFRNDYNQQWSSWSGFSYSTMRDTLTAGYLNQYSAITGKGYNNSNTYAVANAYGPVRVVLTGNAAGKLVSGFYVTNSTYAYLSMRDGDAFAKKFGGNTGNDPDWFKLTVNGYKNGSLKPQKVDFYLADFRSSNNSEDYILKGWQWVNLITLGEVDSLEFTLTSSDTGAFGMNTPAYFCMDNLVTLDVVNSAPVANNDFVTTDYTNDTIVDVLANDVDNTATPLSIIIMGGPLVPGATAMVMNNKIHYIPQIGVVTTDTITYRVCDVLNACSQAKLIIHITGVIAVDDVKAESVQVFPNPFRDVLTLSAPAGQHIRIINALGKTVAETITENTQTVFDTHSWANGIYFVLGDGFIHKIMKP
ncbi:MAG: DUF4465 domain-containing protein [Chitinophagales bacterium]|nr:DUF4465 domain-containing protein [Chitinophagales bacterium]MDW8419506.1 DUF4465 domain-containing protein [Chitinophagales bacterium]